MPEPTIGRKNRRKDYPLSVLMTQQERELVRRAADSVDESVSSFIRSAALRSANSILAKKARVAGHLAAA
jgi:uncharacterized protein (DUF1778 family)